jgi:hypothetical protein
MIIFLELPKDGNYGGKDCILKHTLLGRIKIATAIL